MTAQPGRILSDRHIAVQDGTGGIVVRLPDGHALDLDRGAIVEVTGELAAPYGNLELRPGTADDVRVVGEGGLPDPVALGSADVHESTEGLLARLTGSITRLDRRESGALSIVVEDEQGEALVYLDARTRPSELGIRKGQRIRAVGIVGQRASRSGEDDGHRIWPRGVADIEALGDEPPDATPKPGRKPDDKPPKADRSVRIRDAEPGNTVTITGVITAPAGLIDSDGRRVTVQDRSGAILVRYPADVAPPAVGRRIRASGEVGTWYDSLQLEAEAEPRDVGRGLAVPVILRRPPEASDEWRLVSVTVRIEDVERSGDSWRAEVTMGAAGNLPLVGLPGSGIGSDGLEEGRSARIVGIVKRAHPSASDQRFAVAPRSPKDLRLGRILATDETVDDAAGTDDSEDDGSSMPGDGVPTDGSVITSASLGSLEDFADTVVRVGGRVADIDGRDMKLDDGTGQVLARLSDALPPFEPPIRVGEVLNVSGRVRLRDTGRTELAVRSAGDVLRAATLAAAPSDPDAAGPHAFLGGTVEDGVPELAGLDMSAVVADSQQAPLLPIMALVTALAALMLLGAALLAAAWPRFTHRLHPRGGAPSSDPG